MESPRVNQEIIIEATIEAESSNEGDNMPNAKEIKMFTPNENNDSDNQESAQAPTSPKGHEPETSDDTDSSHKKSGEEITENISQAPQQEKVEEENNEIAKNPQQIEESQPNNEESPAVQVEPVPESQKPESQQEQANTEETNVNASPQEATDEVKSPENPENPDTIVEDSNNKPENEEQEGTSKRWKERSPKLRLHIATNNTEPSVKLEETGTTQMQIDSSATPLSGIEGNLRKIHSYNNIAGIGEMYTPKGLNSGSAMMKDEENKEEPASAMTTSQKTKLTMEDFQKITSVGRGSYGEVFLVKKISNNKLFALKAIDKNFMKKVKSVEKFVFLNGLGEKRASSVCRKRGFDET